MPCRLPKLQRMETESILNSLSCVIAVLAAFSLVEPQQVRAVSSIPGGAQAQYARKTVVPVPRVLKVNKSVAFQPLVDVPRQAHTHNIAELLKLETELLLRQ